MSSPSTSLSSSDHSAFDVSPSSPTCSIAADLPPSFALTLASPAHYRNARHGRLNRQASSPLSSSSFGDPRLPAYVDAPPPAYSSRPSKTITVTQASFDSLSTSGTTTLEQALALSVDAEIAARQRRREAEIRAKLEPVLFPPPRSLGEIAGGLLCRIGKRNKRSSSKSKTMTLDDLDDDERVVAHKMVDEYIARIDQMGY